MGEFGNSNTNRQSTSGFDAGIYVYTRWSDTQKLIVVTNFHGLKPVLSSLKYLRILFRNGV
jgi:hypothetical protein